MYVLMNVDGDFKTLFEAITVIEVRQGLVWHQHIKKFAPGELNPLWR